MPESQGPEGRQRGTEQGQVGARETRGDAETETGRVRMRDHPKEARDRKENRHKRQTNGQTDPLKIGRHVVQRERGRGGGGRR